MAKPTKFRNVPTEVDGIRFDSKREAARWGQLKLMQKAGLIRDLERQVPFKLDVNGHHVCTYRADFTYFDIGACQGGGFVAEDSKGFATPEFKLKAKLMKAVHGIEVRLS